VANRIIIMRHAKSSWDFPNLSDHDRPLNKRGLRDAPRIADELVKREWNPDLILVSSSVRTKQTLESMSHQFGDVTSIIKPEIYHASLQDLLIVLEEIIEEGTTMILGHNPGSEMLVKHLSDQWQIMPTASAALLSKSGKNWKLHEIIRPKEI